MADFSALKTAIQANIRTNGNEEITGAILQDILLSMVTTMGDGAINALAEALAAEVAARQNAVGGEAQARAEADTQLSGRINAEAQTRSEADTQLGNSITAITTRLNEGYVYAGIATPSTNPSTPAGKVFYIALQAGTYTNFSNLSVTQGITILKYNGTAWSQEQLVAIDDVPTPGSNNLVKSGGTFDLINNPVLGLIKWGSYLGTAVMENIKSIRLYILNKELVNNNFALVKIEYLNSRVYLTIKDITNDVNLGIYVSDVVTYSGSQRMLLKNASGTAEDFDSYIITDFTFTDNTTLSFGTTNPILVKSALIEEQPILFTDNFLLNKAIKELYVNNAPSEQVTRLVVYNNYPVSAGVYRNGVYIVFENSASSITKDGAQESCVCAFNENGGILINLDMIDFAGQTSKTYTGLSLTSFVSDLQFSPTLLQKEIDEKIENVEASDSIRYTTLNGITAIRFYTNNADHNFGIRFLGIEPSTKRFYFGVVDNTASANGPYGTSQRVYNETPTGKETVHILCDSSSVLSYAEIDVDWDVFGTEFRQGNIGNIKAKDIYDLKFISGSLRVGTNGATLEIPQGLTLVGSDCTINVSAANYTFLLKNNTIVKNITFVEENSPIVREEYTSEEIAEKPVREYLYKPIISLSDLSAEASSTITNGRNPLIRFDDSAVNGGVEGCTFNNMNRVCIKDSIFGNRHTTPYHHYICNNMFDKCRTGIETRDEFTRIYGNYFFGCIIGQYIVCSNLNMVDNMYIRSDCGLYFSSGTQNAHGEVSVLEFAHIGVAGVYAKQINNMVGFIFSACQFAQAPIIAEVAYALKFSSCRLDTYFVISAGAKNSIIGNNMRKAYADEDGITNIFNVPSDTQITLNRAMTAGENDSIYNWPS